MAKTFSEIQVRLNANIAGLTTALNKASRDLNKFNTDINKIAGAIGVGFGTQQIVEFTKEILQLSGKAEGVALAFNKLPNSIGLINDLRIATRGTISDFELMQRTVQAFNLGIGLKEFPKLLEFATVRAQQTGEEIDYIIQSLVEGIGRKSVLKLDNLGISAERLRNKLGGVSMEAATIAQVTFAFGQIAEEELSKMGQLADTTATKISNLNSAWTSFKIQLGTAAGTALSPLIDGTAEFLKLLNSANVTFEQKLGLIFGGSTTLFDAAKLALKDYAKEAEKVNYSNSAAQASTIYFNNALKSGKTASDAAVVSIEILNKVIDVYNNEIKNALSLKNAPYANELRKRLDLIQKSWLSTTNALRKDENANAIKNQADADAAALDNLVEKLKRYDRILKAFKVGEAKEAVKLIADVTTGKLLRPSVFADQPGIFAVQQRLLPQIQGAGSIEQIFGKNAANNIANYVDKINSVVDAQMRLRNQTDLINQAFSDAAKQGIQDFLVGLGDVAAGSISFGDNFLRAISLFMKQFGSSLIAIGIGKLSLDTLFKGTLGGPLAIAAGTALVAGAGAISKQMDRNLSRVGSGWGGGGSMSGSSGFNYGTMNQNQNINVTGKLVGSGRDLVAILYNTNIDNGYRKGG